MVVVIWGGCDGGQGLGQDGKGGEEQLYFGYVFILVEECVRKKGDKDSFIYF